MTNNDPTDLASQDLRGENQALPRALLEVIQTLDPDHREAVKHRIGAFMDGGAGHPQQGAYRETMDWFVRHIGR